MARKIVINVADPMEGALAKSQSKRITVLERMIKAKEKKKKTSVPSEFRRLNSLQSNLEKQRLEQKQQTNILLEALKQSKKSFNATIVPSPS